MSKRQKPCPSQLKLTPLLEPRELIPSADPRACSDCLVMTELTRLGELGGCPNH